MSSTKGQEIKRDLYNTIKDGGLETFTASEVASEFEGNLSASMITSYLTDISQDVKELDVLENSEMNMSKQFSFKNYQKQVEDINIEVREALDELVGLVSHQDKYITENNISKMLEGHFKNYERLGEVRRIGETLDYFEALDLVEIDYRNGTKVYSVE